LDASEARDDGGIELLLQLLAGLEDSALHCDADFWFHFGRVLEVGMGLEKQLEQEPLPVLHLGPSGLAAVLVIVHSVDPGEGVSVSCDGLRSSFCFFEFFCQLPVENFIVDDFEGTVLGISDELAGTHPSGLRCNVIPLLQ
jgi:hypothetical protein